MPKRTDIKSVLIIGAGPIIIGQACEFDYSGVQACKALREEGYKVILINSNPATIMTDPATADVTYIEPITWQTVEKIIAKEKPDAILPTMGGQTALNCALDLWRNGVLEKYGCELIGATPHAIDKAEDRLKFKDAMTKIGLGSARSGIAHTMDEAWGVQKTVGFTTVIRPSFTLGGTGGGIAYNPEEFETICKRGLEASPTSELLIEESLLGWKEFEMEVVRDKADNCIIVCSIENLDPMGVHTGDSITVAPAQTLTDKEYQIMRNASLAVLREIGVDTGGSNVQFAINPDDGRLIVIEMNPRVSRSSALASKATGFPIAKISAKLALGYTLDEIANDITRVTPAAFEPTLDYVVVKVPRFAFEKFPGADTRLTTTMKSVGEAMAMGGNFAEALQKALRSLETGSAGFWTKPDASLPHADLDPLEAVTIPHDGRLYNVERALRAGYSVEQVYEASGIDPWFVDQVLGILELRREVEQVVADEGLDSAKTLDVLARAKRNGFSDLQLAKVLDVREDEIRRVRHEAGLRPVYKTVDTCAAEFAAFTPYHYSTYLEETEVEPREKPAVIVLGSGPNRIGQGIEFDYACCHAAFALSDAGYETIMVNCNPETVSTDYDTSDRLYFEPLTVEDVLEVVDAEQAAGEVVGVIVQLGGQTPLGLAARLKDCGVPIVGTTPEAIHLAEERGAFGQVLREAGLPAPKHGMATSYDEAKAIADAVGYPVLVRPSYVLGGRGMEIGYDDAMVTGYIDRATAISPEHPVLVDRFLEDAIEIDVDGLYDGTDLYLAGVMEHIEEAGIHSGDSACALPPITLGKADLDRIRASTEAIAKGVGVRGLLNVQYALKDDVLYVLEANPRASRTVPFVSKATAVQVAKAAARIMLGATVEELRVEGILPAEGDGGTLPYDAPISVKEAVLPFGRFRGVDTILGPEMKSTGEVMGIDAVFGTAFAKSQAAAYGSLPTKGRVFVSVANRDKRAMLFPVKRLADLGFEIVATEGTADVLRRNGVNATVVGKHSHGLGDDVVPMIAAGEIDLVFNTPFGVGPRLDGYEIRTASVARGIPCITTIQGASACVQGIEALVRGDIGVRSLQEHHAHLRSEEHTS